MRIFLENSAWCSIKFTGVQIFFLKIRIVANFVQKNKPHCSEIRSDRVRSRGIFTQKLAMKFYPTAQKWHDINFHYCNILKILNFISVHPQQLSNQFGKFVILRINLIQRKITEKNIHEWKTNQIHFSHPRVHPQKMGTKPRTNQLLDGMVHH